MNSNNIDIKNLTKIAEEEFQQHFRDWMEQDDVARSLQAKLRKDLISNFNKTSLGRQIIAQAAVSRRLNLSPLYLALNTLVAEFLYDQNCHFTLSVFCTEVPYRNTLPNFESSNQFRFTEYEIFEVLDALDASSFDMDTKQSISKEYNKRNLSLLFILIKKLLNNPKQNKQQQIPPSEPLHSNDKPVPPKSQGRTTADKFNSKVEYQSKNFRYLNKYLMILSRKMKEMSLHLDILQKQKQNNPPQTKSSSSNHANKFENLNKNLEKISENLRHLSLSKKKNKKLSAVVAAVSAMASQFEKCLLNFDQLNKGMAMGSSGLGAQKSYSDWIHEMRTSENGKLFLQRIESSLRKTISREKKKMETDLEQRLKIQKKILTSKYKQKLTEELALSTSRTKIENTQANEIFEMKLNDFETKHKELQCKIQEVQKQHTVDTQQTNFIAEEHKNKTTQTRTRDDVLKKVEPEQNQIDEIIKYISSQDRLIENIVLDAKLRIQELEHESNKLDRAFQDFLERQNCEKQKIREEAISIWENYALGKTMLDTKLNTYRLAAAAPLEKYHVPVTHFDKKNPLDLSIPATRTNKVNATSIKSPPVFENPFREAKRKLFSKSKRTFSNSKPSPQRIPELPLNDTDSSAENCISNERKQQPQTLQMIEHKDKAENRQKMSSPFLERSNTTTNKLISVTHRLSQEQSIDDISLDGIEISPTTAKSSSLQSFDSSSTSQRSLRSKRQLFSENDAEEKQTWASIAQQTKTNEHNKEQRAIFTD